MRALNVDQVEAIQKLQELKVGALFMGCGTGKTQTAVNLINSVEKIDCLLWICPLRTIENLKEEIRKCGLLYNITFIGIESLSQSDRIYGETVRLLENAKNSFLVCDESIKIKNFGAKRTKRMMTLGRMSEYKLILNGTPITKGLTDIYPQMNFLSPNILNMRYTEFLDKFCCYSAIKKGHQIIRRIITGYTNIDYLMSIIRPYVYQCDLNLPLTKKYYIRHYELSQNEVLMYNDLKNLLLTLEEFTNNAFLGITQKMQHQYSCSKDKFNILKHLINDKTIVFCKFKKSALFVKKFVKRISKKAKVLTYGKNSFGLNLQDYNRIIYFDKTFDYAYREQSEARIYRTGQEDNCEYYDLTGDVGLEYLLDSCIARKESLISCFKRYGKNIVNYLEQAMSPTIFLGETNKVDTIKKYIDRNKDINSIFIIGDALELDLDIPVRHCSYTNTIMYAIWYPWRTDITKKSLVILNESLKSSRRDNLNYNCIRHYLQATDHRLFFNYWPIKKHEEDFMILWGMAQPNPFVKDPYEETALTGVPVIMNQMEFSYKVINVSFSESDMLEYEKEKERLIASVKKDAGIIPRGLLKWVEKRSKKYAEGKFDSKRIYKKTMRITVSQAPVDKYHFEELEKFKRSIDNVCKRIQQGH